jgi:hypothetical protein
MPWTQRAVMQKVRNWDLFSMDAPENITATYIPKIKKFFADEKAHDGSTNVLSGK